MPIIKYLILGGGHSIALLVKNVQVDKRTFKQVLHTFSGFVEQDKIDKK